MAWSKAIPSNATKRCSCGTGTLRPSGTAHFDADGMATIGLACDNPSCTISSAHYWTWKWDRPRGDS